MARTRTKPNTTATEATEPAKPEPKSTKTSKMAAGAPILVALLEKAKGNELGMAEIRKAIEGTEFPRNKAGFYIAEVVDYVNDTDNSLSIHKPKRGYLKLVKRP